MSDPSRCPTPEQLAAFVSGSLVGDELMMVAEHLRDCEDCRSVIADTAWVDRQAEAHATTGRTRTRRRRTWPWWLAAAAAAIASIAYLGTTASRSAKDPHDVIRQLASAAPRNGRYVEPRVSGGFPWAPLQPVLRGGGAPSLDASQMKFIGAAGEVLEETANDASTEARHAAAIAHLIAGRPGEAAALLTALTASVPDAYLWSDLAAARYAAAVQLGQPTQLAGALAAADAALGLHPNLPEAIFNRALIVERLGLRDQARAEWERYLSSDPGSGWAGEARQHLRQLGPVAEFRRYIEHDYDHLARHPAAARELAEQFPQEARRWGETQVLGRWADAERSGQAEKAGLHLRLARTFGEVLAAGRGDHMVLDAVLAIDAANDAQRAALAEGHARFRDAQTAFRNSRPLEAGRGFESAALLFEKGGSPANLLARYFYANTLYERNELGEARRRLELLLASAPSAYAAHRAQVQWQLGLLRAAAGEWGGAIAAFESSIATFEHIREKNFAAAVREILAEVYDRLGNPRAAWNHRLLALQELGRIEDVRLQVAVQAAARAAATGHEWQVSLSFLNLVLDIAKRGGDHLLTAETLLLRARVASRLALQQRAASDLMLAGQAIQLLQEPPVRARAEADRMAVEGFLAAEPSDAVALLTHAIDFHRTKGRRMFLPEMLLARGRARAKTGDRTAAASDFDAGIQELEAQRLSVSAGDDRWGMFSSADELFDEAVTLALEDGNRMDAFAYSERARAREILDSMGARWRVPAALPAANDAVVIEYATLPSTLVIFVMDRAGVRAIQRPIARTALLSEVDRMSVSAMVNDGKQFDELASLLYTRLLEPVNDALGTARTVVFVPDATLSAVPFAALRDREGKYLIERHPVVVTPSAAVYARLSLRPRPARHDLRLLVLAGAAGRPDDPRQLSAVQREAYAVAAAYATPALEALPEARTFEGDAATADIIHFVGHADEPDADGAGALVTAGDHRLDAHSIAALRLRKVRVVVLAACATARGRALPGDESISLARAFLAAGAPSVVATLWPIEDGAAADFFPRLHHHLAAGLAPAEALRATQLEWIQHRHAPPGFWAAVQIIGS